MKYRKKPVVIEAIQWTGENYKELCDFMGRDPIYPDSNRNDLIIETLEGSHIASQYDFIIKGIQGEFYPCKPDIFKETYEPVHPVQNSTDWNEMVDQLENFIKSIRS